MLRSNWQRPSARAQLVWVGAKAIGLHPWHPDVLWLAPYQLEWAAIQAAESNGKEPRQDREGQENDRIEEEALSLIAWLDNHVTRRP